MSGIAGLCNWDGRAADPAVLEGMLRIVRERGPDGTRKWIDGSVGLGHQMLHTTPESMTEAQPLLSECGDLCLTFDGRVDNRNELAAELKSKGVRVRTHADAELILQAYGLWGEECPRRILGDFAFAIWDRNRRQLFCARDPMGIKPLFYCTEGSTFLFGSELRQILKHPAIRPRANEGMVAEYLADGITDLEETLYAGIFRLRPGHLLIVSAGHLKKVRYFELVPKAIRYRTDEEYAEHFLTILREAVRCRLRSHRPVGIYLSGGLDSSSVVACSRTLSNCLETFSLVFPGLSCDESDYLKQLGAAWNNKSNIVGPAPLPISWYREQTKRYRDFPDYPNGAMTAGLTSVAKEKGCAVLLTGLGGDEWLTGSAYRYADLLGQFKFVEFIRQARSHSRLSGDRFSWLTVLRFGIWPLMPRSAQRALNGVLRRNHVPDWINPDFARRTHLSQRLRSIPEGPIMPTLAQEDLQRVLVSGSRVHALEMDERSSSSFSVEHRHPFLDRRILEFALAIPDDQRWRGDQTKFVLRESMRALLPEPIRQRRTKAEFSPVFLRTFEGNGSPGLFDSLTISGVGWIDAEKTRLKYRDMARAAAAHDPSYSQHAGPLWKVLGINLWFQTEFGKASDPASLRN